MTKHLHFKSGNMSFSAYGGEPTERASICRLVGTQESETIGSGIAFFDGASIPWTVLYDEVIVVLEGEFILTIGDEVIHAEAGDVIWVPERSPLIYSGRKAKVFYALYPVTWNN